MATSTQPGTWRVLGVDPGTRIAGYGILDVAPGGRLGVVSDGALKLPSIAIPGRLRLIFEALNELVEIHKPSVLAVESVFHGKSFDSVMKLGEARGVILLVASLHELEVEEYTPATVKRTVTGNGRASKAQVQRMVTRLLDLPEAPEPVDRSDALAVAMCAARKRTSLVAGAAEQGKSSSSAQPTRGQDFLSNLRRKHRKFPK